MASNLVITPQVPDAAAFTVRYGAGSGTANQVTQAEVGKFCKLVGTDRFDNCAVGDRIEGVVYAVELAPQNGFSVASVIDEGIINVTFNGLQATPGTGVVAVGDYVVAGTPTAKGTALSAYPAVCKATHQPGAVPADLTAAGQQALNSVFAWRVVSLGTAGTGAVGTTGAIQRVK